MTIQIEAVDRYFPVMLFNKLSNLALLRNFYVCGFILKFCPSENESLTELHFFYAVQGISNF